MCLRKGGKEITVKAYDLAFLSCDFLQLTVSFYGSDTNGHSLLLVGISKKIQSLHILIKACGEFGLRDIEWGQKARAKTL